MTSGNKISADTVLNLDNGGLRVDTVGDKIRLTILKQPASSIMIEDDEIDHFILAIRAAGNAAGSEHLRRSRVRRDASFGGRLGDALDSFAQS